VHSQANPLTVEQKVPILAAMTSTIEIVIGSLLHGFRIPFGGNFLSLVQAVFLTLAARAGSSRVESIKLPIYVSSISCCLKSLSPAGNKLGPMLSIWIQGALFSTGVGVFGKNAVGTAVGGMLLALWAFVQPVLTLYLFFGNSLFEAGAFYLDKVQSKLGVGADSVFYAFLTVVFVKTLLAAVICGLIVPLYEKRILKTSYSEFKRNKKKIQSKILRHSNVAKSQNIFWLATKDLFQPFFLFSFMLGIVFISFSVSNHAKLIWLSLRPIAVAYVFFVLCRSPLLFGLPDKLGRFDLFKTFASFFDQTLGLLLTDDTLKNPVFKGDTLVCVLLAGGTSTRFGSNKLVADAAGTPIILHAIKVLEAQNPSKKLVVIGSRYQEQLSSFFDQSWEVYFQTDPHSEPWGSLQLALSQQNLEDNSGLLVHLADMPFVNPSYLNEMVSTKSSCVSRVGGVTMPPFYLGGVDVAMVRKTRIEFRAFLQTLPSLDVSAAMLADIDVPGDLSHAIP